MSFTESNSLGKKKKKKKTRELKILLKQAPS